MAALLHRHATLGFIGLGQMGHAMATNLFSKTLLIGSQENNAVPYRFVVCDANKDGAITFVSAFRQLAPGSHVDVVDTPAEVATRANTLFSVLPSSPQVKDVYLGPSGILKGLESLGSARKETLCVDSTTLDVHVARDVASQVEALGVSIVDAPVSGGVVGAKAATLSFMVGGPTGSFELAKKYLERMGQRIIHCGGSGTGLIAKLCNNHILGINQIAVAEGMLLGTSLGLSPSLLASIINTSTGRCWPSEVNNPAPGALPDKSPPCERDYDGGFASQLMLKDMSLALEAGRSVSVPLPIGQNCADVYDKVVKGGMARKDFSVVFKYLRQLRDQELKK